MREHTYKTYFRVAMTPTPLRNIGMEGMIIISEKKGLKINSAAVSAYLKDMAKNS